MRQPLIVRMKETSFTAAFPHNQYERLTKLLIQVK